LVTAGPTVEPIDPVRYITNHSSGKMGFAIAGALAAEDARVILITGPVHLETIHPNIIRVNVGTAQEMLTSCLQYFEQCHAAILAAAVADFTPAVKAARKIKSKKTPLHVMLKPTADIALQLAKQKRKNQVIGGFALETDNELANARMKLKKKKFDFIVLNSLRDKGAGFNTDTNKITILDKYNNIDKFELKSKEEVARDIIHKLSELL